MKRREEIKRKERKERNERKENKGKEGQEGPEGKEGVDERGEKDQEKAGLSLSLSLCLTFHACNFPVISFR